MAREFRQVDVFTTVPFSCNPVAVVLDGEGLEDEALQRVARWTNLSETTFLLTPTAAEADYRVRIFTPTRELPFAGHPTLGTCHAFLEAGGVARGPDAIVQQCEAGLVRIRGGDDGLAFAAPPLVRSGPVEESLVERIARMLEIKREEIVDSQWVDNGPGWVAVLLRDAAAVLHRRGLDVAAGRIPQAHHTVVIAGRKVMIVGAKDRLQDWRRRACSTRMRRMASAAAAKKWPRLFHCWTPSPVTRRR